MSQHVLDEISDVSGSVCDTDNDDDDEDGDVYTSDGVLQSASLYVLFEGVRGALRNVTQGLDCLQAAKESGTVTSVT